MYLQALKDFHCMPEAAVVVGDSIRDLQAADAVGIPSVLVLTGNGTETSMNFKIPADTLVFPDLLGYANSLSQCD